MTTAARPTFDPAKGGACVKDKNIGKLTQLVSSRDLPSHLTLKERLQGQDTTDELKDRDFKLELEERERIAKIEKSKEPTYKFVPSLEQANQVRLALKSERDRDREARKEALLNNKSIDNDIDQRLPIIVNARKMAQLDKDEDFGSENELSESDFTSDDDDPAELLAELQRIKQERLAEEEKREQEKSDCIKPDRDDDTMSNFSVKRRWDDDVPFKNCAREEPDPKKKLFVNDTLRQEFHKRFMDKYIR